MSVFFLTQLELVEIDDYVRPALLALHPQPLDLGLTNFTPEKLLQILAVCTPETCLAHAQSLCRKHSLPLDQIRKTLVVAFGHVPKSILGFSLLPFSFALDPKRHSFTSALDGALRVVLSADEVPIAVKRKNELLYRFETSSGQLMHIEEPEPLGGDASDACWVHSPAKPSEFMEVC